MEYDRPGKEEPANLVLKHELFRQWRARGVQFDEGKLSGDPGTWARLRRLRPQFPNAPLEQLYNALQRAGELRLKAFDLINQGMTIEQSVAELGVSFSDFPEPLRRKSVTYANSSV
jgi:hypothetical protein